MTVTEDAWYEEHGGSLTRAMCAAGEGCSVGTSAKQQLFLSTPLPGSSSGNTTMDFIPVFSVRQVANGTWVGTLSTLGSTGTADSVSMIVQKANANPNQPINFSIVSGALSSCRQFLEFYLRRNVTNCRRFDKTFGWTRITERLWTIYPFSNNFVKNENEHHETLS